MIFYLAQILVERIYGFDLLFLFRQGQRGDFARSDLASDHTSILARVNAPSFANMYALYILGRSNESINGHLRFGLLYLSVLLVATCCLSCWENITH